MPACIVFQPKFQDGKWVRKWVELWEGAIAGKGKGEPVLLGVLRQPNGAPVTAAVKRLSPKEDGTFDDDEVRGLQIEESKMLQMAGRPPFLPVLAAATHPHSPATYHKSDGTKEAVLCIAMEYLGPDGFVETNKLFGWDGEERPGSFNLLNVAERFRSSKSSFEEKVERLREDLRAITVALILVTQAHQGALSRGAVLLDSFYRNIMLPRRVLFVKRHPHRYPADNGVRAIDLGNMVTVDPSSRSAFIPLDPDTQAAQHQRPGSTKWFRSPETVVLQSGRPADWPEGREEFKDALKEVREDLHANRVLLLHPDGREEIRVDESVAVYGVSSIFHAVTRGVAINKGTDKAELRTAAGLGRPLLQHDGRPLSYHGQVDSPLDTLPLKSPQLQYAESWLDTICRITARGMSADMANRGTLSDIETELFRALAMLAPQYKACNARLVPTVGAINQHPVAHWRPSAWTGEWEW
ncbi:unnamed protein product [Vitrella brassicaformis CCMP3155]|uniref:Protein kinase domain-containing protein n=1 Tax=Vitrella brassicaformis (strain CCMP3155) TaxID=1169540 RepID=A0A0G4GX25_VITBC|nr:unnamed protein product [Vitrella brassicaformis CCMP3155]|mmetsp:Transcript_28897/g.83478  ORF Transcript_28897/g.83478 Transcript_28897/m.83478 type:complete len:468 (+) Transcript_28897:70-1473(+)|eukprot:CEM35601.1 unnamed protein product [Vitrella brassicaformis CCMP3155]